MGGAYLGWDRVSAGAQENPHREIVFFFFFFFFKENSLGKMSLQSVLTFFGIGNGADEDTLAQGKRRAGGFCAPHPPLRGTT